MEVFNNIKEYDKKGRIIKCQIKNPELIFNYIYNEKLNIRTCVYESEKNRSNFLEIITEKKEGNNYIPTKREIKGDIYETIIEYNNLGLETFIKRINKHKDSLYIKNIIRNNKGEEKIWIEKYNDTFNLGFKVDLKKINIDF